MGEKKTKPSEAVVMKVHKRLSKRVVLGLLLVLLPVLIATSILIYVLASNNKDADSGAKDDTPKTTADVITKTDTMKYSGNYDKAVETSAAAYEASSNNDDKYNIAQQTGAIYETKQDYKNALEWYKKAEAIKPDDRGSLVGLARMYEALGDKEKAIEYYKKVLALKDTTGFGVQNDQAYYQYRLDQLMGAR